MAKTYQISNNTIFSVNDDGSISRIAEISDDGRISGLQEKVRVVKEADGTVTFFMWVAIVAACVLGYLYYTTDGKLDDVQNQVTALNQQIEQSKTTISSLQSTNSSLQNQLSSLRQEKNQAEQNLQSLRSKVGSSYPLIISDIQIANTYANGSIETDYGQTIYSSRSMYLTPKISYEGITPGNVTLDIKLIRPNGQLSSGTSSPSGYSYSSPAWIYNGSNTTTIGGWGNSSKGNWPSGTYRFEVWFRNTCLKSKTFTIY